MMGRRSTHLLLPLLCLLLLITLLSLQAAGSPIAELLGQGLKQSALHHQSQKTCGGGEGGGLPVEWKELGWKEYSLTGNDGKHYKFREYVPEVFCRLREQFQIDSDKFYASLTRSALKDWENPAKSGSAFVTSADGHFMLKSLWVKQNEPKVFQERLSNYVHYMSRHPNSFVTRYLGYYSVQEVDSDKIDWFLCMPNILAYPAAIQIGSGSKPAKVDYRFDLKGYKFGRKVKEAEWKKPEPTFKEWEFNGEENGQALFKGGILLEEKFYREIAEIISQDAKFLGSEMSVLDYSMFIGIHFNDNQEEQEAEKITSAGGLFRRMANGGIPARCIGCKRPEDLAMTGPEIGAKRRSISLYIGTIDLLSHWNLRRCARMVGRVVVKKECTQVDQSYMHPSKYAARFKCFLNGKLFRMEDEKAMNAFEEKYCAEFNEIVAMFTEQGQKGGEKRKFDDNLGQSEKIGHAMRKKMKREDFKGI